MPFLVEFGAAGGRLSGSIPTGLTKLTELLDIYLYESNLNGTLPQDIGNLSKLTHLALQTNSLTGSLPTSFYDLTSLENMYLFQNSFSGSLAPEIGNFVSLKQMQLSTNQFTGVVPSDVARMTSLGTSSLSCSSMRLFLSLSLMSQGYSSFAVIIYLEGNNFTGGMENFCTADIDFNAFRSDCFFHETFAPDQEVECSCCTVCCRNEDTATAQCVPNNGNFAS